MVVNTKVFGKTIRLMDLGTLHLMKVPSSTGHSLMGIKKGKDSTNIWTERNTLVSLRTTRDGEKEKFFIGIKHGMWVNGRMMCTMVRGNLFTRTI